MALGSYLAKGCVVALAVIGASGCVSRSAVSVISSKTLPVANVNSAHLASKGPAHGEDCQHVIVFVPTSGVPTIDEALDRALEAKQANLLTNATITFHSFYIPYIYGQTCWKAEGEAYDVKD